MPQIPTVPYRSLLLASVAVLAISGGASGQTISTSVTGPVNVTVGTPLIVTGSGSILSSGGNNAVVAGVVSPSLSNSGLLQASGTGIGLHVTAGGSLNFVTNGGTVAQAGGGSQAALRIEAGGTIGVLNNLNTGSIGNATGVALNVFGQLGTLTNSGTIGSVRSLAGAGIILESNATATSIVNNAGGQIVGGRAVSVYGSAGTITNAAGGTIASTRIGGYGVYVGGGGSVASMTNSGVMQANGDSGRGIPLYGGTISGLTNIGTIQANGSYGVGIGLLSSSTIGSLSNVGTIQANGYRGVGIGMQASAITSLTNTGTIQANGSYGVGIRLLSSSTIGSLSNAGTIQANGYQGAGIFAEASTITALSNTGLIQANGGYSAGVVLAGGSVGTLTNSGTIQAKGFYTTGIVVAFGTIGSIVNSGAILATDPDGVAITVRKAGTLASIANNAGGLIQGGSIAIDHRSGVGPLAIVNAGQIVGDIAFGTGADSLTINGGTVAGNITGQSGSGASVTFNTTVPYVLGNTINNVDNIVVQSGTVTIQQFGSVTTPISNALAFNIGTGGAVRLNSGTVQASAFLNQGLLDVGTGTPVIAGALTQTATGRFGVGITGPANGKLTITGAATLAGGVVVSAPTVAAQAVGLFGQTFIVLSAASLTAPLVGSTTTSATPGPAVVFTVGQSGNNLTLTGKANPITALVPVSGSFNLSQIESGLDGLLKLLLTSNDLVNYAKIVAPFTGGTFTTAQQQSILTKLEASLIGSNQVALSSILSLEGAATAALTVRQTAARETNGMSAGDDIGRGYQVWVQPFGSFQTQNATGGVDGSTSNSYGMVAGADTLVRPDLRVGLALTIGNTDIAYSGNLSGNKGTVLTTQLALYATWYQGHWFVDGAAGGGINWYTTHESAPAFGGNREAEFSGTHLTARVGTGYDWMVNSQLTITPYASIQDTHFNLDGYTTHGLGLLDLKVSNKAFDALQSRIGAKAAYTFARGGYTFTPELHSYYLHNFGADQRLTTSESFVGGGPTFSTIGPARDRDVWNVGLGLTMAKIGRVTLTGTYDYLGGSTSSDHQVSARFKTDF
jgi:outer membrane autotransporter protein